MPLNNVSELPPDGWRYEQPGRDGKIIKKFKGMMPFSQFCREVLAFRQANRLDGADSGSVRKEVEEAQCVRLGHDPRWCQKKTASFSHPIRRFQAAANHVLHAVTLFSSGLKTLKDWGDEGFVPVPQAEAQARSDVCTGRISRHPCPFNQNATFPLVGPVAETIKRHVEKKNQLKLSVLGEDTLRACKICQCHLGLKIHVPIRTLLAQMTRQTIENFKTQMPKCWINQKP